MLTGENLLALLFLIAAMWGAASLAVGSRKFVFRHKLIKRARQGKRGEKAAAKLLEQHGYQILDAQRTQQGVVHVDGTPHTFQVRADYLVESNQEGTTGQKYVVEVKTGHDAPQPTTRATRRQLLEYQQIYDVDGVLLADMQAGELHHIRFEQPTTQAPETIHTTKFLFGKLIATLFIGILIGWVLARQQ